MSPLQVGCPACGAPVTFTLDSSLVTVGESCRSVVGRGDGALESYGKVADLVETNSPLELGLTAKFRGVSFEIVGRTQYKHAMGGVWDEWHVAFANGRWSWLTEAQGRFYLTFEREVPDGITLPAFDSLVLGERIKTVPKVPPLQSLSSVKRRRCRLRERFHSRSGRARCGSTLTCRFARPVRHDRFQRRSADVVPRQRSHVGAAWVGRSEAEHRG